METKESKYRDALLERQCRTTLSIIYNGGVPDEQAKVMLSGFPAYILAEVLLDTFNRVDGCFRFNETVIEE